jgi:hypothetical protein
MASMGPGIGDGTKWWYGGNPDRQRIAPRIVPRGALLVMNWDELS